jgi:hypothetical protein
VRDLAELSRETMNGLQSLNVWAQKGSLFHQQLSLKGRNTQLLGIKNLIFLQTGGLLIALMAR